MPKVEVVRGGTFEVAEGTRLVNALADHGEDISYRCGGYGGCTTCRVRFEFGEPTAMTEAEHKKLAATELLGEVRLACQCLVGQDMKLEVLMRVSEQAWVRPGTAPEPEITPPPEWRSE
ncbi:MAG: 2Fe-2S iron-sulfur cluster-binding protein [Acidobacteriota bacterium]